jgi:hypothetical protein
MGGMFGWPPGGFGPPARGEVLLGDGSKRREMAAPKWGVVGGGEVDLIR